MDSNAHEKLADESEGESPRSTTEASISNLNLTDESNSVSPGPTTKKYRLTRSNINLTDKSKVVSSESTTNKSKLGRLKDPLAMSSEDDEDFSDVDSNWEDDDSDATKEARSNAVQEGQGYWSPSDRALLLAAIKKHGMLNIPQLAKVVEKDETEIKAFFHNGRTTIRAENLKVAKAAALKKMTSTLENKQNKGNSKNENRLKDKGKVPHFNKQLWEKTVKSEMGDGPIEWWLSYMEQNTTKMMTHLKKRKHVQRRAMAACEMLPKALQVIAKYEKHPDPSECAGVNYKDAYEYLAHMMSGVPGKALNPPTAKFIQRSVNRLRCAMLDGLYSPDSSHHFGAQLKHIWTSSKDAVKLDSRSYGKDSKTDKLTTLLPSTSGLPLPKESIQALMKIPGFNLLNVPESLLQMAKDAPVKDREDIVLIDAEGPVPDVDDTCVGIFSETDFYAGDAMNLD